VSGWNVWGQQVGETERCDRESPCEREDCTTCAGRADAKEARLEAKAVEFSEYLAAQDAAALARLDSELEESVRLMRELSAAGASSEQCWAAFRAARKARR
jgi:hypothetical protein